MSKVKTIAVVALGVVVLAGSYVGFRRYCDYRRACADRRADQCLRAYAAIVGDGRQRVPAEKLKPILDDLAVLTGKCSKAYDEPLFSRRLDGAFLLGDYALAEKMMDDVPGKSVNWKEGAKAKIRAHAALERGDTATAIAEFEAFCQTLLREGPDAVECDPCSGVEWSCEGLVARNKKRMSELAAKIGDKERAAKFLSEAREYAAKAIRKPGADEEESKILRDEFGLPKE